MSKWRVGGKVPLNVYENDVPMFQCHTPEQAARIVKLLNEGERATSALEVYKLLFTPSELHERIARFNGPLPAIAAAPASKEPRSGTL